MKKEGTNPKNSSLITALLILALALLPILFHFLESRLPEPKSQESAFWLGFLNSSAVPPSLGASSNLTESLPGASQLALGKKIDLNRASERDLEVLPGIGPKMAKIIVQDRKEGGPFLKVDDLLRVKGFKEKKFLQIKDFITVQDGLSPKL